MLIITNFVKKDQISPTAYWQVKFVFQISESTTQSTFFATNISSGRRKTLTIAFKKPAVKYLQQKNANARPLGRC
jgi:hypothetical protein